MVEETEDRREADEEPARIRRDDYCAVLDRRSHPDNKEQWRKRTKRGEWGRLAVNTEIAGPSYVG